MNQRLLKVPMWRAKLEWQRRVQRTLRVQIRDNGSFRHGFGFGFWAGGMGRRLSTSEESSRRLSIVESSSSSALIPI